ncbi:hypothetical protein DPMN_152085 [Dreissena polymorpha]|uniref:Uncharacterized protein n=1 Tax=Dreissena polymorpha TaxID=45954 RepID=A0A9D4J4U9_DREPO|nr:hypothetical protein DPMN_152085 [Dreissena polymorpha]
MPRCEEYVRTPRDERHECADQSADDIDYIVICGPYRQRRLGQQLERARRDRGQEPPAED